MIDYDDLFVGASEKLARLCDGLHHHGGMLQLPDFEIFAYSVSIGSFDTAVNFGSAAGARFRLSDPISVIVNDADGFIDPISFAESEVTIGDDNQGTITGLTFRTISLDVEGILENFDVALIERFGVADYILVPFNKADSELSPATLPASSMYFASEAFDIADSLSLQQGIGGNIDPVQTEIGTEAGEILNGLSNDDMLRGLGGDDTLIGLGGDDVLDGGAGIDTAVFSGDQASYTLTLSPTGTTVTDRRGAGNGTDDLINIEFLDFDSGPFNLSIFGGPAGLSATELNSFIELYIAYFNRAPDAVGLNFWGTVFANGFTLPQIALGFIDQEETRAAYPETLTNADFATAVYANVLGRIPDQSGFDFWVGALDSGGVGRDQFILSVLGGAKVDPQEGATQEFVDQQLLDRQYLADKTDIGAYFAVHKGMSEVADAVAAMRLFDGTEESIVSAVNAIDGFYADALDPDSGDFLMPLIGVLDDPFSVM